MVEPFFPNPILPKALMHKMVNEVLSLSPFFFFNTKEEPRSHLFNAGSIFVDENKNKRGL